MDYYLTRVILYTRQGLHLSDYQHKVYGNPCHFDLYKDLDNLKQKTHSINNQINLNFVRSVVGTSQFDKISPGAKVWGQLPSLGNEYTL